jgi:outer membrane usher protein
VRVNFGVRTNTSAAILVLTGPDGQPIPAGSEGKVEGGERFVVGYDGRAWVKGLAAQNTVSVELPAGECHGAFDYSSRANEQVTIPVGCH